MRTKVLGTFLQILPAELREMVYLRSFQALPNILVPLPKGHEGNSPRTPVVPPGCYVKKSLLAESLPAILACADEAIIAHGYCGMAVLNNFWPECRTNERLRVYKNCIQHGNTPSHLVFTRAL